MYPSWRLNELGYFISVFITHRKGPSSKPLITHEMVKEKGETVLLELQGFIEGTVRLRFSLLFLL